MTLQSPEHYADEASRAKPRSYRKAECETRAKDARLQQLADEVLDDRVKALAHDMEAKVRELVELYRDPTSRKIVVDHIGDLWTVNHKLFDLTWAIRNPHQGVDQ